MSEWRLVSVGDSCLSVVFEEKIDPAINDRCIRLAEALQERAINGVLDIVPTFHSVAVYFDSRRLARDTLERELARLAQTERTPVAIESEPVRVPVMYGGAAGPDIASVALFGRCSEEEVVHLHTAPLYRVYMLGFLPGFAYLGLVDRRIAMPRLETPRLRVPSGSVAIAGVQTGIYPCETPGGWRIIGRSPTKLFDPARPEPFLLKAGDHVKFVAV
jgi:KipI family sensor histidine kinase inhibitor